MLFVNDGSRDKTAAIVREMALKGKAIKLVIDLSHHRFSLISTETPANSER
jgi:hypothetical protein